MRLAWAALYGLLPPMTEAERAEHERTAAAVPYRSQQGDLPLRLPEPERE